MKKIFYLSLLVIASVYMASCGNSGSSSYYEDTGSTYSDYNEETPKDSRIGDYIFTDELGREFTITLNEDETATLKQNTADGYLYYGSWEKNYGGSSDPHLFFEENPPIIFPCGNRISCRYMTIVGDYLYGDDSGHSTSKTKSPRKRLNIRKVN